MQRSSAGHRFLPAIASFLLTVWVSPDAAGSGIVTTDFASGVDAGESVAVQADGKILVAGHSLNGTSDFALARYNPNGWLDSGFGVGGIVTTPLGGGATGFGLSVAVQGDGKILVAGSRSIGNADFALVRYDTNGALDGGFGVGGIVITPIGSGSTQTLSACTSLSTP